MAEEGEAWTPLSFLLNEIEWQGMHAAKVDDCQVALESAYLTGR